MDKKRNLTAKKRCIFISFIICSMLSLTACGNKKEPSNLAQGMDAIKNMEFENALTLISQAQEAGEDLQQVKRGEGIAYLGLAQYDEAIEAFEESLSNAGWNVGALERDTNYYLASAFEKKGDHQSAIEVYDAIINMWPKEKLARTQRGFVHLNNGDFESAKSDFDSVISTYSTDYDNLIEIFKALESAGYSEAGEEYLRGVLADHNDDMNGYDKGRIYYYLKDYDQARNSLEGVRDSGADAILYLGLSYEALGDYNYATSVYQSYITSGKGGAMIYNQLGICEMQMSKYQDAYNHFSQGLELEDVSCRQSLLYNQICASEYMGDFANAKSLIGEYLKLYPEDEAAKREQIFLSSR